MTRMTHDFQSSARRLWVGRQSGCPVGGRKQRCRIKGVGRSERIAPTLSDRRSPQSRFIPRRRARRLLRGKLPSPKWDRKMLCVVRLTRPKCRPAPGALPRTHVLSRERKATVNQDTFTVTGACSAAPLAFPLPFEWEPPKRYDPCADSPCWLRSRPSDSCSVETRKGMIMSVIL
jgi:hypothetical protein